MAARTVFGFLELVVSLLSAKGTPSAGAFRRAPLPMLLPERGRGTVLDGGGAVHQSSSSCRSERTDGGPALGPAARTRAQRGACSPGRSGIGFRWKASVCACVCVCDAQVVQ